MTAGLLILIGATLIAGGAWQVRNSLRRRAFDEVEAIPYRELREKKPFAFWANVALRALSIPVGAWVIIEAISSISN